MATIFDTDVISVFAKLKKLDILIGLFPDCAITPEVYEELLKPL